MDPSSPNLAAAVLPLGRAAPPCPHFGPCGGCQIQHLTYPAQLASKATKLRTSLELAALKTPDIQLHASPPLAYRNRIRLTLGEIDGRLRAGYLRNPAPLDRKIAFLPITQCPIAAPILWRAAEIFLSLTSESPTTWLRSPNQISDQLELFTAANESALQLTLYLRSNKPLLTGLAGFFRHLCESLRAHIPELTGAGISLLPAASAQRSRRAETARPGPAWGAPGLSYSIPHPHDPAAEIAYWVPRTAFFQVNRFLLPDLLALVDRHAQCSREKTLAWDLYAGVGLFSRVLARSFAQVTAVEIAQPALLALTSTKLASLHAVKSTTFDFLRAAVLQRERPGLIVLDPPRSGAGPEVCALLGRIAARTLIYVSCSPQTLPADLVTLATSGYTVAELHLVDLFPQTTHIETVAVLTR